jgi:hypothetical protein
LNDVWHTTSAGILEQVASQVRSLKEGKLLIPLNIANKHWVGIAIDKNISGTIKISYMDSEQQAVGTLKKQLTEAIAEACPEYYVEFVEVSVEKQKYNNCGSEVIENFIQYLTQTRLSQDEAVPHHSKLLENLLMEIDYNVESVIITGHNLQYGEDLNILSNHFI